MTDLVKRLRATTPEDSGYGETAREAAVEIDRLTARVTELENECGLLNEMNAEFISAIPLERAALKDWQDSSEAYRQDYERAASALESLSAENAALKDNSRKLAETIRDMHAAGHTLLQQRNEAFERAAKVAESFADRSIHHYHAVKIAAAIRNLSKES